MELLQPWGLIALLGLPAIVALYFLRQRRPPRVVGSLMLWQMARAEVFRGRPWERFRPSLLLWLQLLAMAAVAMALARPACVSVGVEAQRLVLVLDASASMASTDVAPSRWREAVSRAAQAASAAPEGSEVAVLVAGRLTQVAEPFTRDRARIARRLEALAERGPDAVGGELKEALLLALQLGGEGGGSRDVVLLSDGAFDAEALPPMGASTLSFVGVGQVDHNLAITTFEVRRGVGRRFGTVALCTVTNTGSVALEGHLQLRLGARLVEARRVSLEPGAETSVTIPIDDDEGRLHARLIDVRGPDDARDVLPTDDEAWAVIAPEEPIKLELVGTNPLVARALASNPRVEVVRAVAPEGWTGTSQADVVIFEGFFPATLPQGRFLALGMPPDNPLLKPRGEALEGPVIASWDRSHPSLLHLDLGPLRFGKVPAFEPSPLLAPLAEFQGQGGAALLVGQTPSWRALVWTPPLLESDLPLRVAFPVFLYNAVGWLSPGGGQRQGRNAAAGEPLGIPAIPGAKVSVRRPDGRSDELTIGQNEADGLYLYHDTGAPGFYEVTAIPNQGEARRLDYGVSLVDAAESAIAPRQRLTLPHGGTLLASGQVEQVQEQVQAILWALLLLLGVEWLVYLWRERQAGAPGSARRARRTRKDSKTTRRGQG